MQTQKPLPRVDVKKPSSSTDRAMLGRRRLECLLDMLPPDDSVYRELSLVAERRLVRLFQERE